METVGNLTSRLGADCQRLSNVIGNDIHLIIRNAIQVFLFIRYYLLWMHVSWKSWITFFFLFFWMFREQVHWSIYWLYLGHLRYQHWLYVLFLRYYFPYMASEYQALSQSFVNCIRIWVYDRFLCSTEIMHIQLYIWLYLVLSIHMLS